MFFRLFALFAVLAVAFANPDPKPEPQLLTYTAGAAYPAYSAYSAYAPVAYAAPYGAAYRYAYPGVY